MKIYQSGSFRRKVKHFNKIEKSELNDQIRKIVRDPSIGIKKGDLKGVFIHKFKIKTAFFLLSYRMVVDGIELITIGSHENYYRILKSYLKGK